MSEEIKEILRLNCEEEIDVKYFAKDGSLVDTTFDYSQLLDYIDNLQQKVEQLENIRKEAIEATKDVKQFVYDELVDRNVSGATETHCKIMDLLNILNKGSDKE